MNKSLTDWINSLLAAKAANTDLAGLTSTSKTSVWRAMLSTVAFCIWNFQELVRAFMDEVNQWISEQKVPNKRWYRYNVLNFQYGFELIYNDSTFTVSFAPTYNDNGTIVTATDEQIEASKIIKYCSVTNNSKKQLLIKVAREDQSGNTIPLLQDQLTALAYYVSEFEATGDKINIVNYNPDILLLQFDVCYDPLVLNANGMNKITAKFPVKDAILAYMKNLPFDGELSVQKLEEVILNTDGVTDLLRKQVSSKWIDSSINDYGQFQPISIAKIPKSGHFKIEDWSGLNYIIKQPQE